MEMPKETAVGLNAQPPYASMIMEVLVVMEIIFLKFLSSCLLHSDALLPRHYAFLIKVYALIWLCTH